MQRTGVVTVRQGTVEYIATNVKFACVSTNKRTVSKIFTLSKFMNITIFIAIYQCCYVILIG